MLYTLLIMSGSAQEGKMITSEAHLTVASQQARETFGIDLPDNYAFMKMIAPRFLSLIENSDAEEPQDKSYKLSKVSYKDGRLTYSLTPPFGSPLPFLEISQNSEGTDDFLFMYRKPDFPSFKEERQDRGMIDHFNSSVGGRAQYLENLTNAYNYLQKHGIRLANCRFPLVDQAANSEFPQINRLMERNREAIRIAEERANTVTIPDILPDGESEDALEAPELESAFMRSVREMIDALYPSGEIGAFGQQVLLAADAYDTPTEVDDVSRWMWRDRAEFAVGVLEVASFMRGMLSQARKNPGMLGLNEKLFIVSTPYLYSDSSTDEEYVTLVTHTSTGEKQVGSINIRTLPLPGGDTRVASPGAPSYIGRFPRTEIDPYLRKEIDLSDFTVRSDRGVVHGIIMMHETLGSLTFDRPLNLEIIGEPKREIIRDPVQEAAEVEMRKQLWEEMIRHLTSPQAATVEYYTVLGKEPSLEREGAAWERFIVLNSVDGEYGIAIQLLRNDPNWQQKDSLRLKPRGDRDQLRLVFLRKKENTLGSVVFSSDFKALIETFPDNHAGLYPPDGGRLGSWEDGRIFVQDPRAHVGTTDRDEYTPPREMTEDELLWLLDIVKNANFDADLMPKLITVMMGVRHQGSRIVDADPFLEFLKSGEQFLHNPKE